MKKKEFVRRIMSELFNASKQNKTSIEKIALDYGITDKTLVKELTELAIVNNARLLALEPGRTIRQRYDRIVELYHQQVNISHRTSQSILLQQYSTPAPIGFLAGIFSGLDTLQNTGRLAFEPSAGNGLLTIAASPNRVYVNEIDAVRNDNLLTQGYAQVWKRDASKPFFDLYRTFDAVITNPPFGTLDIPVFFEDYKVSSLEHLMSLYALDTLSDNGKAAFIIGGHTRRDDLGRIQAGKNRIFFNYLYSRYFVKDVINIDGKRLYSRQGTSFDVRLILIDGRKPRPEGVAPLYQKFFDVVVRSFDELYGRVMTAMGGSALPGISDKWVNPKDNLMKQLELEAEALRLELELVQLAGINGTGDKAGGAERHPQENMSWNEYVKRLKSGAWHSPEEKFYYDFWQDKHDRTGKYISVFHYGDNVIAFSHEADDVIEVLGMYMNRSFKDKSRYNPAVSFPYERLEILQKTLREQGIKVEVFHQPTLGAPYQPASNACIVLDTQVPDSMSFETQTAIDRIRQEVGGDIDNFVRHRLGYATKADLCKALSAEQVDAVGIAIYNIEARGQGMIIGDQTGIGKGRVAAGIIRYATQQGLKAVFLTEKANLFSDIYRDLSAIGSGHLRPFIVNARESKTDVKDEDGNIIYQAASLPEQQAIFSSRALPPSYDFVLATYSQFNSAERKPEKPAFLMEIAPGNIFIMDEAHNSSGSSNTGSFLQGVVATTKGVVFLSATFAKRPDNMPIYAMKTAIADCTMSKEELVEAITRGGVALQEVLSSQLVAEGQMLRRERSFEGIEVNYITLDSMAEEHRAIADNITEVLRDIIAFQNTFINDVVKDLDKISAAEGKETEVRKGTSQAGVDNTPYFSKIFNVINQMLFSLKAVAVAEQTIRRLKQGLKPVIAFASTMGSFIETLENETGMPVGDGDTIQADFSEVLYRGLEGVLRYTEKDVTGKPVYKKFSLSELAPEATGEYQRIYERITGISTGITISPIDVIVKMLKEAGYTVAEVTGRKFELQLNTSNFRNGLGKPGGTSNYNRGDMVTDLQSGKSGKVEAVYKKGKIIPGQDSSKNYEFTYSVKFDDGDSETFKEDQLKSVSTPSGKSIMGLVLSRKKLNTNDAFRKFNNNEVDVLMINQSGSTGASAHAVPTAKVPKDQVCQRVMIVLQAELDINTEVQKRGRINRTGQILKPIYDYVTSAIPAEKRLMMMLQKKLKSLDANTTSNQKQSTKILDVPDFLNKYGDKIVVEYLSENMDINDLLGDPLHLTDPDSTLVPEDAAHRVSGRVAVLNTKMQQDFYNEIGQQYNDYVEYLQQVGEYDLEVEAMDLQAETINARVVKMGKGADSAFGDDSLLETVEANVLRKPFTRSQLDNLLMEVQKDVDPMILQQELIAVFEQDVEQRLQFEIEEIDGRYEALIKAIPDEKKIKKLEKSERAWAEAVKEREKELNDARNKKKQITATTTGNKKSYLLKIFNFFYSGRFLNYPVASFGEGVQEVPAVFIGFAIDFKKKNPYVPSQIKLRFAIASSNKYLAIPTSYSTDIMAVIGASGDVPELKKAALLDRWETYIQQTNVDRKQRHIITGNLLQAFSDFKGKLISYTTLNGKINKGILLPENWDPVEQIADKVTVPIIKALPLIKSLVPNSQIVMSTGLSFFKQGQQFKIIVGASRVKGGDIYLDKELLKLVEGQNFQKTSDKMVAELDERKITEFVRILQDNHGLSMTVNGAQFREIEKQGKASASRKPIELPPAAPVEIQRAIIPKTSNKSAVVFSLLELEAEAIELELLLLAA